MYEKEVAAGIALLDAKRPGWREKIDLKKLRQMSGRSCVLGQLYGNSCSRSL